MRSHTKNAFNSKKKNKTKHCRIPVARLVYTDYDNYYLNQLWVRKVDPSKVYYDARALSCDKRTIVNYIRHRCSNYDHLLSLAGNELDKENYCEFHHILKKECLYLIGRTYPNLSNACNIISMEVE